MGNHVHLLIKEGKEVLSNTMKRIGASYVHWYNWQYNRKGHLFQDRYKSEAVEDDAYFLTVLRYIHQNPLKAGLPIILGHTNGVVTRSTRLKQRWSRLNLLLHYLIKKRIKLLKGLKSSIRNLIMINVLTSLKKGKLYPIKRLGSWC